MEWHIRGRKHLVYRNTGQGPSPCFRTRPNDPGVDCNSITRSYLHPQRVAEVSAEGPVNLANLQLWSPDTDITGVEARRGMLARHKSESLAMDRGLYVGARGTVQVQYSREPFIMTDDKELPAYDSTQMISVRLDWNYHSVKVD